MGTQRGALAGVAVAIGIFATGCSAPPAEQPQTGSVPAGSAEVTVNGQKLAPSDAVDCTFIQSTMTITTGDNSTGATVVVDNQGKLVVKSVGIRNLGGFTGSYWQNLGGDAAVDLVGRTFTVTGTADGFNADQPSKRAPGTFSIKASC